MLDVTFPIQDSNSPEYHCVVVTSEVKARIFKCDCLDIPDPFTQLD